MADLLNFFANDPSAVGLLARLFGWLLVVLVVILTVNWLGNQGRERTIAAQAKTIAMLTETLGKSLAIDQKLLELFESAHVAPDPSEDEDEDDAVEIPVDVNEQGEASVTISGKAAEMKHRVVVNIPPLPPMGDSPFGQFQSTKTTIKISGPPSPGVSFSPKTGGGWEIRVPEPAAAPEHDPPAPPPTTETESWAPVPTLSGRPVCVSRSSNILAYASLASPTPVGGQELGALLPRVAKADLALAAREGTKLHQEFLDQHLGGVIRFDDSVDGESLVAAHNKALATRSAVRLWETPPVGVHEKIGPFFVKNAGTDSVTFDVSPPPFAPGDVRALAVDPKTGMRLYAVFVSSPKDAAAKVFEFYAAQKFELQAVEFTRVK